MPWRVHTLCGPRLVQCHENTLWWKGQIQLEDGRSALVVPIFRQHRRPLYKCSSKYNRGSRSQDWSDGAHHSVHLRVESFLNTAILPVIIEDRPGNAPDTIRWNSEAGTLSMERRAALLLLWAKVSLSSWNHKMAYGRNIFYGVSCNYCLSCRALSGKIYFKYMTVPLPLTELFYISPWSYFGISKNRKTVKMRFEP